MTTPPPVPARVVELVDAFGAASYCYAIASSSQTIRRMGERDAAHAALLAAIADAIEEARKSRDDISRRFGNLSNASLLASNILYNLAGGATLDERAKMSCKEVQAMLDEARRP